MATVTVLGAGHNGLVSAIILQKHGFDVTVVEQKDTVGGACANDIIAGQIFNWGANHIFMLFEEVIHSIGLDLERLSLKRAHSDAEVVYQNEIVPQLHELKGRYEEFSRDLQLTADVFRNHLLNRHASIDDFRRDLDSLGLSSGSCFLDGSITEVIQHYFPSECPAVARLLSGKVLSFYPPSQSGSAIALVYLACANELRFGAWSSPLGGTGSLVGELQKLLVSAGGQIRLSHRAVGLLEHNGQVSKVICDNDVEFATDFVIASMPSIQLVDLFGSDVESRIFDIEALKRDWTGPKHDGGCSKMLIRASSPLRFLDAPERCLENSMLIYARSPDEMEASYCEALVHGHSLTPYFEVFSHSLFFGNDEKDILYSIYIMYSSYETLYSLDGNVRLNKKEILANYIISNIQNMDQIVSWDIKDPIDLFNMFGLPRGNVDHGLFVGGAILDGRRQGNFELAFKNLICCSPGFAGGGLVSGLPGYLAAREVICLAERRGH